MRSVRYGGHGEGAEKNAEVGTRNDVLKASCFYFIVPRSYFCVCVFRACAGERLLLPAALNLPAINDASLVKHVVVRMLRGGQAGMVGEDAKARADF